MMQCTEGAGVDYAWSCRTTSPEVMEGGGVGVEAESRAVSQ